MCTFLSFQTHLKWHIIDIRLHNVRKLCALKNAHLCVAQECTRRTSRTRREVQTRLELTVTGIAPNSRQQSKTVIFPTHKFASMSLKGCLFDKTEQTERESASYGYY